jgi:hypothetical protein
MHGQQLVYALTLKSSSSLAIDRRSIGTAFRKDMPLLKGSWVSGGLRTIHEALFSKAAWSRPFVDIGSIYDQSQAYLGKEQRGQSRQFEEQL